MPANSAATHLDDFDRAILAAVQRNNQCTHAQIGMAVGLSPSAVRRRLSALRSSGVITADVSVMALEAQGLAFIVQVTFVREDPATIAAFRNQMQADPAVSQCYSVSGDIDFVLIVHAETPARYEDWGAKSLMSNPAISRYSSSLIWSRVKFSTAATPA